MESLTATWIEAEHWAPGEWTPDDDVTDVIATLSDGSRWIGTFCAFNHVSRLRDHCAASGECLGGRYLWASDLILIESTARESVEAALRDLLRAGELRSALALVASDVSEAAG